MSKRHTRRKKQEESYESSTFHPKNQKQAEYKNDVYNYPYVLVTGRAGTGKTYVACRLAARFLNRGLVDKIVLCRPALSASKSLGYFKGTKEEKMLEWIQPMLGAIREDFSQSEIEYMIKVGKLEFVPLETIKGHSMKKSFVIIDEAEDCNVKEMKSIMTRLGEDSKMVVCGDTSQSDLKGQNGLAKAVAMRDTQDAYRDVVAHHDFSDPEDIVRSKACATVVLAFEGEGV